MSWIVRLGAALILAAACGACGHEGTTTPIPYEPPDDRGPAAWRWFERNAFSGILTNTGSRNFLGEPGTLLARGGTVLYDLGLWIGVQDGGQARVSATSLFGSEFEPLLLPDTTRALVYILGPETAQDDPDFVQWPVEAGAPSSGGLPQRIGNLTAWTAYDDLDPARHRILHSAPIGAEVRQTIWAFEEADSILFQRFEVRNASATAWEGALLGVWVDADLGDAQNDLVGCDPERGLGYTYNAASPKETVWGAYQPAVGIRLVETPGSAGLYAFPQILKGTSEPATAADAFNLLQGLAMNGAPMTDPDTHEVTRYAASGDPVANTGWIESAASDRRLLLVTGPVRVAPGESAAVTYAIIFARAVDRLQAVTALRNAADALPGLRTDQPTRGAPSRGRGEGIGPTLEPVLPCAN